MKAGIGILALAVAAAVAAADGPEDVARAEVARAAALKGESPADTHKARNEALNVVFRAYLAALETADTGQALRRFNALLREKGLTSFDDFLRAETEPVRYVRDPESGARIPVVGALGSDLINPWLVAYGISDGVPMRKQPMYDAAAHALREHTDFALIGIADTSLSVERVPAELRENVRLSYRRLNPTNEFAGGFDHPLYYATLREAARKLFREDYPQAKLTMAQLVQPEAKGGFGIASCLLCHGQNHTDVYKRLLGEGLHYQARLAEGRLDAKEAALARSYADVYHQSAEIVLKTFPDKVDARWARESLAMVSGDNVERLMPGYDDFVAVMDRLGCMKCHRSGAQVDAEQNPGSHGAFLLVPNAYHKVANIKALAGVIDLKDLDKSDLLKKAGAKVKHRGSKEVSLKDPALAELREALETWVKAFVK